MRVLISSGDVISIYKPRGKRNSLTIERDLETLRFFVTNETEGMEIEMRFDKWRARANNSHETWKFSDFDFDQVYQKF